MVGNTHKLLFTFGLLLTGLILFSQDHTVGVLTYSPWHSYDGYNLIYPENQSNVYLLDNCGQIVHQWEEDDNFVSGKVAYLQPDGSLVKTKRYKSTFGDPIQGGGQGAFVEIRDWDNELLWQFEQNNSMGRLHHDIAVMPNGNILLISWENYTEEQIISEGRDPNLIIQNQLWPDYILEVNPELNSVVWEWHVMDHVIQDFDSTKLNYGVVGEHPELIDLNWDTSEGKADWNHVNSVDYNEALDQIVISVPTFNEFWIIDHSTTMEESAGHSGGDSGKGGDLLYRWGNPAAYRQGNESDQKLFFQHDVHWIDDFVNADHPSYGKIALFNNRISLSVSTANVLNPEFDTVNQVYLQENNQWLPADFDETYTHPIPSMMVSGIMSSIQVLPNENVLICASRPGYSFEMTPAGEVVWEYKVPLQLGEPIEQGTLLAGSANITFRMDRYPLDFSAFEGRNLSPTGYLELEPDVAYCDLVLKNEEILMPTTTLFPNPATNYITIDRGDPGEVSVRIIDILGRIRIEKTIRGKVSDVDVSKLESGIYVLELGANGISLRFSKK